MAYLTGLATSYSRERDYWWAIIDEIFNGRLGASACVGCSLQAALLNARYINKTRSLLTENKITKILLFCCEENVFYLYSQIVTFYGGRVDVAVHSS